MRAIFVATLCGCMVFVASSRCNAGAEARASGAFTENDQEDDVHYDPIAIRAKAFKVHEDGSVYNAVSSVAGPKLGASALSVRPDSIESQYPRCRAEAIWEDELTLENPDLLLNSVFGLLTTYAFFAPQAKGSGHNGDVNLDVYLSDVYGHAQFRHLSHSFEGSTSDKLLRTAIPIRSDGIIAGVLSIRLALSVGTNGSLNPGETSSVHYEHTAYLPPIFIGDEAGNPIPELAGLRFIGASGLRYPVTTVQRTPGDYNGDGVVNAADYTVWRDTVGQTGLTLNADGDGNQIVDDEDYQVWKANFGQLANYSAGLGDGSAASGVPEPSTLGLAVGLVLIAFRNPRGRL